MAEAVDTSTTAMLIQALEEVLNDKGFQQTSPFAAAALEASKCLLGWCQDSANTSCFNTFAASLHAKLHRPFIVPVRTYHRRREKMWASYHSVRCSDEFTTLWKRFLTLASYEATPILYQNITDRVFRKMMKVAFPITDSPTNAATPSPLTHRELNTMRYMAGYVCKTVKKRVNRMKPVNTQLKISIDELLEDNSNGNDDDIPEDDDVPEDGGEEETSLLENVVGEEHKEETVTEEGEGTEGVEDMEAEMEEGEGTERVAAMKDLEATSVAIPSSSEWTYLVNRGGLLKVTDDAFDVFVDIEEIVRTFYCKSRVKEVSIGKKDEIIEKVMQDEQVMEDWSYVAVDMEENIEKKLLMMLVEEWVKIRGFSFAGGWLEVYKNDMKKTLQHSKGLRKNLLSQDTAKESKTD